MNLIQVQAHSHSITHRASVTSCHTAAKILLVLIVVLMAHSIVVAKKINTPNNF
jgi:hypothetical protein